MQFGSSSCLSRRASRSGCARYGSDNAWQVANVVAHSGGFGGYRHDWDAFQNETNIKCCSCRTCGRTYTSIEAMQVTGADATEWLCHDDFTRLEYDEEARRRTASNDKRLTQQLAIFTEMLAALKDVEIPR